MHVSRVSKRIGALLFAGFERIAGVCRSVLRHDTIALAAPIGVFDEENRGHLDESIGARRNVVGISPLGGPEDMRRVRVARGCRKGRRNFVPRPFDPTISADSMRTGHHFGRLARNDPSVDLDGRLKVADVDPRGFGSRPTGARIGLDRGRTSKRHEAEQQIEEQSDLDRLPSPKGSGHCFVTVNYIGRDCADRSGLRFLRTCGPARR